MTEVNVKRCPFCGAKADPQYDHTIKIWHSEGCYLYDGDHPQVLLPWSIDTWNERYKEKEK